MSISSVVEDDDEPVTIAFCLAVLSTSILGLAITGVATTGTVGATAFIDSAIFIPT
jgi:hypothetical protein